MFSNFSEFIGCLVEAKFSFTYIWQFIIELYYSVTKNPDMQDTWSGLMSLLEPAQPYMPYILIAIGFIVLLFGKKMGGILKFIGFFAIGYAAGVYFLEPAIPAEIPIPGWVVGLVIAVIAAVAYKFLFVGLYSVALLYSVYRLCYHGFFLDKDPVFTSGKALTSLAIAAIILVISLILFKFVEMIIFASLGSWIIVASFSWGVVDLGVKTWVIEFVIIVIIAVLGSIFQIRTRRRY